MIVTCFNHSLDFLYAMISDCTHKNLMTEVSESRDKNIRLLIGIELHSKCSFELLKILATI